MNRIRRSLDDHSAATLVQAFVASRADYCVSLLIGAPKKTTDKLQRVLNAAARVVSNTRKYDRGLSRYRRSKLHWLDVDDRVRFRVCVQVYKCLHNMAPGYLSSLCQPVSSVPGRQDLRSADCGELGYLQAPYLYVLVRGSRVCLRRSYKLELTSYSPYCANVHSRVIHASFGPPESTSNGISIGSAVFAQLTIATDRQTDR